MQIARKSMLGGFAAVAAAVLMVLTLSCGQAHALKAGDTIYDQGGIRCVMDSAAAGNYAFTVTASQAAAIPDYNSYSDTPWAKAGIAASGLTSVRLQGPITGIGSCAFYDCKNMQVTWGTGLQIAKYGNHCFYGCSKITTAPFTSTTSIGRYSFAHTGITKFAPGSALVSMDNGAFSDCASLASIDLSSATKLSTIPNAAFANCTTITGVIIPGNVELVVGAAFVGCTKLGSVTFCEGVQRIGEAFNNCSSTMSFYVPGSCTEFGPVPDLASTTIMCSGTKVYEMIKPEYKLAKVQKRTYLPEYTIEVNPQFKYTGSAIEPSVRVADANNNVLSSGLYKLTYKDNVDPGTATVTATGTNGVAGSISATFQIIWGTPASTPVVKTPTFTYSGKAQQLVATVEDPGTHIQYSLDGSTWTEEPPTFTSAGTYAVQLYGKQYQRDDSDIVKATVVVKKAKQTAKVSTAKKSIKRGKSSKVKVTKIAEKAKYTCKKVKKGSSKYLTVTKPGKIKVSKKAAKGKTYKIKVKFTFKATANYGKRTVTKTIKVKVK